MARQAGDTRGLVLQERRFERDTFINLSEASKFTANLGKRGKARNHLDRTIAAAAELELSADDVRNTEEIQTDQTAYAAG